MINKPFEIVAAVCNSNGIGCNNTIPWQCPADIKHFRILTCTTARHDKVNAVIMGRKTWQSLNCRPLPGRLNIVISHSRSHASEPNSESNSELSFVGCHVFHTLMEAYLWLEERDDVERRFIIGGGQLYHQAIGGAWSKTLHLTHIAQDHKCDTFFPKIPDYYHLVEARKLADGVILKVYHNRYGRHYEECYLRKMRRLLDQPATEGRNGSVHSDFQWHFELDMADGIPIFSTRKAYIKGIIKELLFFVHGKTNTKELEAQNIMIWRGNTTREFLDSRGLQHYEEGDMGPMYGWVWRHYGDTYKGMRHQHGGFDQLRDVLDKLLNDPNSRRILMTAYDPSKVAESVLAPCHSIATQFNVRVMPDGDRYLDMFTYQRSADMFLGVYFNIPSDAILLTIIAYAVGMTPGRLYVQFGDCHVYSSHREAVLEQIKRTPSDELPSLEITRPLVSYTPTSSLTPSLTSSLTPGPSNADLALQWIESLTYEDFKVNNYCPQPAIHASMVV